MSGDTGERRLLPVFLLFSAFGFSGIVGYEGYVEKAKPPVPGDVPTYGIGSTIRPDGKPVKNGDTISVPAAIDLALREIRVKESALKSCITAPLFQREYDVYVSMAYNIGTGAFCRSTLVKKLNAHDYDGACAEILRWRYFQGKDCAMAANAHLCGGIWKRRQDEAARCRGEQQ